MKGRRVVDRAIRDFASYHAFDPSRLDAAELDAIKSAVACKEAVDDGYRRLPTRVLEDDATVGVTWHLYQRCLDRIDGALIALISSSPVGAEIIAKASIEACMTLRYILKDRYPRLAAFLASHINNADRQERLWRETAEKLDDSNDRRTHLEACDYRRIYVTRMREFIASLTDDLVGSSGVPKWPEKVSDRFDDVGEALTYRTVYARLCGEPHFDAEETIREFFGKTTTPQIHKSLQRETLEYTRFVVAVAVCEYAEAGESYAQTYGMEDAAKVCRRAKDLMSNRALALSSGIGALGAVPGDALDQIIHFVLGKASGGPCASNEDRGSHLVLQIAGGAGPILSGQSIMDAVGRYVKRYDPSGEQRKRVSGADGGDQ